MEDLALLDLSHNMINKVDRLVLCVISKLKNEIHFSGEFSQIGSRLRELRMAGCHLYEVNPLISKRILKRPR